MDDDKKSQASVTLKPFDPENLYEKRFITDPNAGDIVMLLPIIADPSKLVIDGEPSMARTPRFLSSITVSFRGMPRTLGFEIEALTLAEALAKWAETAERAGREFHQKAEAAWTRSQLVGGGAGGMPVPQPKIVLN